MKVSELTGQLLNFWAAKANGDFLHVDPKFYSSYPCPKYSEDWAEGGPIIEREDIAFGYKTNTGYARAHILHSTKDESITCFGRKKLEAAMRCYVTFKFGEEVPDEPAS